MIALTLFSGTTNAESADLDDSADPIWLSRGEPAPFTGVFFTEGLAKENAQQLVERDSLLDQLEICHKTISKCEVQALAEDPMKVVIASGAVGFVVGLVLSKYIR